MKDKARMRTCLKCRKRFLSRGPGNRICKKCNAENFAKYRHLRECDLASQRGAKRHNGLLIDETGE